MNEGQAILAAIFHPEVLYRLEKEALAEFNRNYCGNGTEERAEHPRREAASYQPKTQAR